jgi:hypothetical protein
MIRIPLFIVFLSGIFLAARGQTGPGVGIYATGTETGIGFRSGKESPLILEARLARVAMYSDRRKNSSFSGEVTAVARLVRLEKVRFHIGLGGKIESDLRTGEYYGAVVPIGVEAFPFPFQNAGLFFEAAPFLLQNHRRDYSFGIRTTAGFVFYFIHSHKTTKPS